MNVTQSFKDITDRFVGSVNSIKSFDEKGYNIAFEKCLSELKQELGRLQDDYPLFAHFDLSLFESDPKHFLQQVIANQQDFSLSELLPSGLACVFDFNKTKITQPAIINLMEIPHIFIPFQADKTIKLLEEIIFNALLFHPLGETHVSVFSFERGYRIPLLEKIPEGIFQIIGNLQEAIKTTEKAVRQIDYDLAPNETAQTEYMVFLGRKDSFTARQVFENYKYLLSKRNNTGVHVVLVDLFEGTSFSELFPIDNCHIIRCDETIKVDLGERILDYPNLSSEVFSYLRNLRSEQLTKKEEQEELETEYTLSPTEIIVPVGINIDSKQEVELKFNSSDFIHGFILGQSGSGKSTLLRSIINAAILKYSPEDLRLYLMDFKGVELNRYQGIKHVKALLVDNSDPQMTLEVLRELREEYKLRKKRFQTKGSDIKDIDLYNQKYPESRMPQILFVADECQVMFSVPHGSGQALAIQREISEIVNIIATQGRSFGIHMLLATQQLDDTEISGQVLKNLTECFLMRSARIDSELLVPDSSELTEKQPKGQVCYYHHKELVGKVQTYYIPEETKIIQKAREKAKDHKSNGEAYFNGSAMYWMSKENLDTACNQNNNRQIVFVGHDIGLSGHATAFPIHPDFAENILIFGNNQQEQASAVAINSIISLMSFQNGGQDDFKFIVINCLGERQQHSKNILEALSNHGYCRVIDQNQSGEALLRMAEDLRSKTMPPMILCILGHERFTDMKRNSPLHNDTPSDSIKMVEGIEVLGFSDDLLIDANGINAGKQSSPFKNYHDAFKYILDEGPMQHVHVILQVDKPANILFEGEYGDNATEFFRHRIILRSENKHLIPLKLSEDIDVQTLSDDEEHLRAYYYPEGDLPQLFTPLLMPDEETIETIIPKNR